MQSIIQPTQLTAVVRPARLLSSVGASGDVRGPGSATDGQAALFDGPSGRRLRATATGAVGLALLARSTLTSGSLLLGAGAGAPTELATTSYGRSFLGLADPAAGRSLLQLGAGDSPTFAGLTTTGQIACQGGLFRQSGGDGQVISVAASASYAAWLMAMTDRADYNGIQSVNSSYTARWGIGRFGESSGIAFYEGASRALWLTASAPGTAGAGEVRVGGGQINAASDIETATKFRVNGSDQPVSTVSLQNVSGGGTLDLLTVGDNEMWSLAIGNATDGYMVHAVFGKPSASSGAVMATNDNTNANLTVALVGNILRVSNGVGATRTMIYTLTKLR